MVRETQKTSDPRKVSVYLEAGIIAEIEECAKRQCRSVSNVVRIAWKLARERIRQFPAAP